jgi:hypothetical protein
MIPGLSPELEVVVAGEPLPAGREAISFFDEIAAVDTTSQ